MIILVSDPTHTDLEFVLQLLKSSQATVTHLDAEQKNTILEWLPPAQFEKEMNDKGYKCSTSKTRKAICNKHGIVYQKRGKELWFRNELSKIPNKSTL
jgi:hypothetical protein